MIFGIGTDIVDINRINEIDSIDNFVKKILSKNEKNFFENLKEIHKVKYLAKQFAGKEAIAKALGTGFTNSIKFSEIEILRNSNGKPLFEAVGSLKKYMDDLGITKTHVSLSDEKEYAIAFAVLEII
tara:strand:+ start:2451 stop:2831 length:381 start_codon:yes stop_codon:yes gene_type:complete